MALFSSKKSKSTQSTTTTTKDNSAIVEDDGINASDGSNVTRGELAVSGTVGTLNVTDQGAISAGEAIALTALQGGFEDKENAFEFLEGALGLVSSSQDVSLDLAKVSNEQLIDFNRKVSQAPESTQNETLQRNLLLGVALVGLIIAFR